MITPRFGLALAIDSMIAFSSSRRSASSAVSSSFSIEGGAPATRAAAEVVVTAPPTHRGSGGGVLIVRSIPLSSSLFSSFSLLPYSYRRFRISSSFSLPLSCRRLTFLNLNGLAFVRRDGARVIRRFDQESEQIRPPPAFSSSASASSSSLSTVLVSGDDVDRGRFTRVRSSVPTTRILRSILGFDDDDDTLVVVVRGGDSGGGGLLRALLRRHRFRRSQLQRHFPRALHRAKFSFEI